ncbi:hypothetical protein C8R42DRAFT_637375 [Lentinula raphanica]|nr:hypothetical protein C8R42DRAFT_637375 [Lentinula raphanica]
MLFVLRLRVPADHDPEQPTNSSVRVDDYSSTSTTPSQPLCLSAKERQKSEEAARYLSLQDDAGFPVPHEEPNPVKAKVWIKRTSKSRPRQTHLEINFNMDPSLAWKNFEDKYDCIVRAKCSVPSCTNPMLCHHDPHSKKRFTIFRQQVRGGLALVRQKLSNLNLAESIPPRTLQHFQAAGNEEIAWSKIPPPSSWSFSSGDEVIYRCGWFQIPGLSDEATGFIRAVLPLLCEVEFPSSGLHLPVPQIFLYKKIQVGMSVRFASGVPSIKGIEQAPLGESSLYTVSEDNFVLAEHVGLVTAIDSDIVDVLLAGQRLVVTVHANSLLLLCNEEESNRRAHSLIPFQPNLSSRGLTLAKHPEALDIITGAALADQDGVLATFTRFDFRRANHFGLSPNLLLDPLNTTPRTGQIPWRHLCVYPVGQGLSRKGRAYTASVKDVKPNVHTRSGLSVLIRYENTMIEGTPEDWVDYDQLRRADNNRFIHDGDTSMGGNFYRLKTGYKPEYTNDELLGFYYAGRVNPDYELRLRMHQRRLESQKELEAAGTSTLNSSCDEPSSFQPRLPSRASTPTETLYYDHWVLDPHIALAVGDRDIYVACTDGKDHRVGFRFNGRDDLMVVESMDHKGGRKHNRQEKIVDLHTILSRPRSFSVKDPFKASGEHIGKLARRVTHRSPGHSLNHDEALYVLQEVHYREEKKGSRLSTVEYFDEVAEPMFELDRNSLVLVHESAALKSMGNRKMTALREKHGGNTNGLGAFDKIVVLSPLPQCHINCLVEMTLNYRSRVIQALRNRVFLLANSTITSKIEEHIIEVEPISQMETRSQRHGRNTRSQGVTDFTSLSKVEGTQRKAKGKQKRGRKVRKELEGDSSDIEISEVRKVGSPEKHQESPSGDDDEENEAEKKLPKSQAQGQSKERRTVANGKLEDRTSRAPVGRQHVNAGVIDEQKGWEIVLQFSERDDMKLPDAEEALRNLYGKNYDPTIWREMLKEIDDFEGDEADWMEIQGRIHKKIETAQGRKRHPKKKGAPTRQARGDGTGAMKNAPAEPRADDGVSLGQAKGARTRQAGSKEMAAKKNAPAEPRADDGVSLGQAQGARTRQAGSKEIAAKVPAEWHVGDGPNSPPTRSQRKAAGTIDEKKGWEVVLQFFTMDEMKLPAAEAALRDLYGEGYNAMWHDTLREINDFDGELSEWWEIYKNIQKKLGTYVPEIDDWPPTRKVPNQSIEDTGMKAKDDDNTEGGREEHAAGEKEQSDSESDSEFEDTYLQWDLDHYEEAKSVDPVAARRIREQYLESVINAVKELTGDSWEDRMVNHPKLRHVVQKHRKSAWDKMHRIAHTGWRKICDSQNPVPTSPVKPLVDYQSSLVMDGDSDHGKEESKEGSEVAAAEEAEEEEKANDNDEEMDEEESNDEDEKTDEEERRGQRGHRQRQRQKQKQREDDENNEDDESESEWQGITDTRSSIHDGVGDSDDDGDESDDNNSDNSDDDGDNSNDDGDNSNDDGDESDDNNSDNSVEGSAQKVSRKGGPLSKEVRALLDEARAQYSANVKQIATEAGKNVHTCYAYLDQKAKAPRRENPFNAFQMWYAEHGKVKKKPKQRHQDFNKFVRDEYEKTLESRLSKEEMKDKRNHARAMKMEMDWAKNRLDRFVEGAKNSGKISVNIKSMMHPAMVLGERLYETAGVHLLGWVITTERDCMGRSLSAFFAGDEIGKAAKQRFGSKMDAQLHDLEMMFRQVEMDERSSNRELSELMTETLRKGSEQRKDRELRVLGAIFKYDIKQLLGEPEKISLNNFVTRAWKHHIRIKNWPVGAAFPKVGEEKKEDNEKKSLKSLPTHHIRMAFEPRMAHLQREYDVLLNQVPPNAPEIQAVMYELEYWTEDEVELQTEEQGNVPLVIDVNGKTIVKVSDVDDWVESVGDSRKDLHQGKKRGKVPLYEDDEDEDEARIRRGKKRRDEAGDGFIAHLAGSSSPPLAGPSQDLGKRKRSLKDDRSQTRSSLKRRKLMKFRKAIAISRRNM